MKFTKLKYDKFNDYLYEAINERFGIFEILKYIFKFENGYGAIVIKTIASYGHEEDLFELCVIKFINEYEYELCYDTEITDYAIGYLNNDEVLGLLERIKNL